MGEQRVSDHRAVGQVEPAGQCLAALAGEIEVLGSHDRGKL